MLRKLGFLALGFSMMALPALASDPPGSISGYVRSSAGVPQMGAVVELLGSSAHNLRVFTDDHGFYSLRDLLPGSYSLKGTARAFLAALRDRSSLRSGANRPVLRVLADGSPVTAVKHNVELGGDHDLKASLSFLAGSPSEGYGAISDMSTGFLVEHRVLDDDAMSLRGNVGYGQGAGSALLRASYTHHTASGSAPEIALTVRRLAPPVGNLRQQGLQSFSLTTADDLSF